MLYQAATVLTIFTDVVISGQSVLFTEINCLVL